VSLKNNRDESAAEVASSDLIKALIQCKSLLRSFSGPRNTTSSELQCCYLGIPGLTLCKLSLARASAYKIYFSRHPWTHMVSGMFWGDPHVVAHGPCSANPKEGLVHWHTQQTLELPLVGFADSGNEDRVQKGGERDWYHRRST
jgi:hypothetical protein